MAVTMARQGGLGVIHRNHSIEDQAHQVDVVKRSEAGMIDEPITISPEATIGEADAMCGRYRISGVPEVDNDMRLLGIVTNRDMRFEHDPSRLVGDVMTKMPLVTGPEGISSDDAMRLLARTRSKLPLVDGMAGSRSITLRTCQVRSLSRRIEGPGVGCRWCCCWIFGDAWSGPWH
jgi:IMP dehydrogenase